MTYRGFVSNTKWSFHSKSKEKTNWSVWFIWSCCIDITWYIWDFLARPWMRQGVDYVTDGCAHDLLSTTGFLYAIRQILRVKEGGLNFWGLPCNSFSFMARSLHQRTADSPFGCQHHGFVIAGNILATRMVCLIALAIVRRLRFFVEQPDRSMAIVFPYLMHIMSFTQIEPQRVFWWMPYLIYMQSIGWNPSCILNDIFDSDQFWVVCLFSVLISWGFQPIGSMFALFEVNMAISGIMCYHHYSPWFLL